MRLRAVNNYEIGFLVVRRSVPNDYRSVARATARAGLGLIAIAAIVCAIAARSGLVVDTVIFQTAGEFSVVVNSNAGELELTIWFHHFNWLDTGIFGEYRDQNRRLDSGVIFNCFLRGDPEVSGINLWKQAASERGSVHVFGLAARFVRSPIRLLRLFIPEWIIIALLGGSGTFLLLRAKRQSRDRVAAGAVPCLSCGYDLRGTPPVGGLSGRRCPECGAITPEKRGKRVSHLK
jgi:hypothetical protein